MGARLIFHTLLELSRLGAHGCVENVILLGAPLSCRWGARMMHVVKWFMTNQGNVWHMLLLELSRLGAHGCVENVILLGAPLRFR
jgi:hypothetical protein